MLPRLFLMVACTENRVIAHRGRLPWRIPEDKAYYKRQTLGHTVIVGRQTFHDWTDAAVGREVVVVTRDPTLARSHVVTAPSVPAALEQAAALPGDIYVCGGQRIYEECLPLASRLYLTLVHATLEGDRFFPDWRHMFTKEVSRRESQDGPWRYTFLVLER